MPTDPLLYREEIELALGDDAVALFRSFAVARGLRAETWLTQPDLCQVATTQAALVLFTQLRAGGESYVAAIVEAAERVGLAPEAFLKRRKGWIRHLRKRGTK